MGFTISKANPIKFIIDTGAGKINDGVIIEGNAAYPSGQTCNSIFYLPWPIPYDCSDSVKIQIEWTPADTPILEVKDSNGTIIYGDVGELITGDIYQFVIDFSDAGFTCGECYTAEISGWSGDAVNDWTCACNGDFECAFLGWGVSGGTTNVISATAVAHSGVQAAQITASAVPLAGDRVMLYCTSGLTLTANRIYKFTAWVRDNLATPFTQDGESIELNLKSGFADAVVLGSTSVIPSVAGRDVWHEITYYIRINSVTTGTIEVRTTDLPQANGIAYIDDITGERGTVSIEATSETIRIDNLVAKEFQKLVYYNDENGFGIDYTTQDSNGETFKGLMRIQGDLGRLTIFPDNDIFIDSTGKRRKIWSQNSKIKNWLLDFMPDFQIEIFSLALEHDSVKIDDISYVTEEPYEPEFENYGLRKGEIDVYVEEYNYQNMNG